MTLDRALARIIHEDERKESRRDEEMGLW